MKGGEMNTALLIIRIAVGGIVAIHGSQKLFGWFSGHGIAGTAGFLESLGFRPARGYAILLGTAEFVGGVSLALGLVTPITAAVVAGVMIAAVIVVHWSHGFFAQNGGFEYPLALAASSIALAFSGPGRYSLDRAFDWTLAGSGWGLAAAVLAVVAASAVSAARAIQTHRHRAQPTAA
jgi:putative oxidoreductase